MWTRRTAEAWARAAVPWELSVERGVSSIARGKNAPWVLHMSGWSANKNHTLGLLISRGNVSAGTILRRIFTEVDRQLPIPVARSPNGVRPQGAPPLRSNPATVRVVSKLNSPSHQKLSRLPKLRTMSDTARRDDIS